MTILFNISMCTKYPQKMTQVSVMIMMQNPAWTISELSHHTSHRFVFLTHDFHILLFRIITTKLNTGYLWMNPFFVKLYLYLWDDSVRRKEYLICLFMPLLLQCASLCGSSNREAVCRSSCIACKQKVSRRCVKACDTSNHWNGWKRICIVYTKWAFLQCVLACDSSDF